MMRIGLAVTSLALAGCLDTGSIDSLERPIYHGTDDTKPSHAAVVAVTWGPAWGYFCSGTLIEETVVLTAAHCLEDEIPEELEIFFGQDTTDGSGQYRPVSDFEMHEDYDGWAADVGIIYLAEPAPAEIAPIPHLPRALALTADDVGATVEYSGFGLTETGTEGRKLRVDGTIEKICPGPGWCDGDLIAPRSFYYSMDGGGPCEGDSGGPTFLYRDGVEYVIGVTSYGDWRCRDWGVNADVSAYAPWIEERLPAPLCPDPIDCNAPACDCPPDGDGDGDPGGDGGEGEGEGGCGCRASGGTDAGAGLLALLFAAALIRRRSRTRPRAGWRKPTFERGGGRAGR